jgi:hypothetical protein
MSIDRLGMPAAVKHRLVRALPQHASSGAPFVDVWPRGVDERRCAACRADHYEVAAYYVVSDYESLVPLEKALQEVPGVYVTTQMRAGQGAHTVTNPGYPEALGVRRRDLRWMRPCVLALMRDDDTTPQAPYERPRGALERP